MIINVQNSVGSIKQLLELISDFRNIAGWKNNCFYISVINSKKLKI